MAMKKNRIKKTVTSYDVARAAGVSQSTVSRAFRPGMSVSNASKIKVMKTAKKLGYKPNAIARMLISQSSGMIAIVTSDISNGKDPHLLPDISDELSKTGKQVLLFTLSCSTSLHVLLNRISTFQVDGIIDLTAQIDSRDLKSLDLHGTPTVLCTRHSGSSSPKIERKDSQADAKIIVDLLRGGGCRNYAIPTCSSGSSPVGTKL